MIINNIKKPTGIAVHKVWSVDDASDIKPVSIKLMRANGSIASDAIIVRIIDKNGTNETVRETLGIKSGTKVVLKGAFIQGANLT